MSIRGILIYSLRAAAFAAVACGIYAAICLLRRDRIRVRTLLGTAYIASLVQITVLRGGIDWNVVFSGVRAVPALVPFGTTIKLIGGSVWDLIYNIAGNILWFVPLGFILGKGKLLRAFLLGAVLSAAIEISQYLLVTGFTDMDDIIFNAVGALFGWFLYRCLPGKRRI